MTETLFVTGSGGVGKTTVSGALATAAAELDLTTLVVTVDPARRLAQALGVDALGNEPVLVPGSKRLHAAMLDARASWEALVRRHTDPKTADRLIASPFFDAIADRFPSGQAYAVAEETARLVADGGFELIVVDTPPIGGGADFFSAPDDIATLVGGRALRILAGPSAPRGRLIFALTARPALRLADRILGSRLLQDVAQFLTDLATTYDGIQQRSGMVKALLDRSDRVVVTTPDPGPVRVARHLLDRHPERIRTVIANRVVPPAWADAATVGDDPVSANFARWSSEARRHREVCAELAAAGAPLIQIPWVTPEPVSLRLIADLARSVRLETVFS